MTLNVRQLDADDGPNAWLHRRDVLTDMWLAHDPDIVGTQELHRTQAEDVLARAPQYTWFGRGRYGDDRDKHVGIFVHRERVRVLAAGDRWFSETPDEPGTRSWRLEKPRHLTWGVVDVRGVGEFSVLNTHFPYRPDEAEARRHAARLVLETAHALAGSLLLTGDFNAPAGSDVHTRLCKTFDDAWETSAVRRGPDGTVHGFGTRQAAKRIDWVLYRAPWRVLEAETVTWSREGRYPSDHFPVVVTFAIDAEGATPKDDS